jgi:Family of unknown function (DUF6069)
MSGTGDSVATARRVRPLIGALAGAALALVGNIIVFFVANAILGSAVQASTDGTNPADLPIGALVIFSVIPLFAGAAVLWALSKFTKRPLRVWTIIAVIVVVLSFVALLGLPVAIGSKIALAVMHVVAGLGAIVGQRWASSRAPRQAGAA